MLAGGYRDLVVWQKSMQAVVLVYKITALFPREEMYGLVSQMRRAALSIPSNIAEGFRRGSEKEFRHFLRIAFGSAAELETQIDLAIRLKFTDVQTTLELVNLLDQILRMLNTMTSKLPSTSY
ncbi:MAG: four helix bundle protein [Patescibacteria group bacterium]|jgi:four helix bundle protein